MADRDTKPARLESEVRDLHLKEEDADVDVDMDSNGPPAFDEVSAPGSGVATPAALRLARSPIKPQSVANSPAVKSDEETIGGEVTLKLEPGKPPKLSRTVSHKVEKRPPQLFLDYEDKTAEATSTFELLPVCTYANRFLGTTEHALECDCSEEWDQTSQSNHACGEDSDCINRATKMECVGDCNCGTACQNTRFQRKQYANVAVIKTDKKGFGLRTETNLRANDFIFEYIGEVIGDNVFRRRMGQYDEQGIKHFYFMSLTRGEFVDATKKGNLGRFCNHSCNPNCYVDKWVVGDKLRMGIFAERDIQVGEELTFNYNVDRYGAEPQPCYCAEPNCTGFIGGKTQTERGTKLSNAVIEALGIDDAEAWDTAVAKRPRKKKAGEDDEEYVNNVEPRGLDEDGVNKVMSSLMQCKEKWIAVKLLTRIQRADDEKVRNRVVRFHGYRILKTALSNFSDDVNVALQVLDILGKMPRLTRNKIQDSKIEEAVGALVANEDARVSSSAKTLLDAWAKLEVGYRIPRMKRDPDAASHDRKLDRVERRDSERRRSKSRSRSKSPDRIHAPTGPRSGVPQRATFFGGSTRSQPRFRPPPPGGLPVGWCEAVTADGSSYYYTQAGTTTWQRPTVPATAAPPPPPPKAVSDQQLLQDLIKNIVATKKEPVKQPSAAVTPVEIPKKERKEDKWRAMPEEKRKKMYESALQPHIMHVVGKYKHKLAKDDLKRWAKEFAKQMVESDFKKKRVEDPSRISDKRVRDVKKHAQTFFEKAVKKKEAAELKKAERKKFKKEQGINTPVGSPPAAGSPILDDDDDDDDDDLDGPELDATPEDPSGTSLKRAREVEDLANLADTLIAKKQRTFVGAQPSPPPPPPPGIDDSMATKDATPTSTGEEQNGFSIKGAALASREATGPAAYGTNSAERDEPGQIATPPITGSPDRDETARADRRDANEREHLRREATSRSNGRLDASYWLQGNART